MKLFDKLFGIKTLEVFDAELISDSSRSAKVLLTSRTNGNVFEGTYDLLKLYKKGITTVRTRFVIKTKSWCGLTWISIEKNKEGELGQEILKRVDQEIEEKLPKNADIEY